MTAIPMWLAAFAWLTVILMFAYGVMFFTHRALALKLTGHTESGAVSIVGARFFFFGAMGAGLLLMAEYRALSLLLGIGVFVALGDLVLERAHGGEAWPHLLVAFVSAVLSYFFANLSAAGVS